MQLAISEKLRQSIEEAGAEVGAMFNRLASAEAVMVSKDQERRRRYGGVWWAGPAMMPFEPHTAEELFAKAKRLCDQRTTWIASADGQFVTHLNRMETLLLAASQTLEEVRSARSRGLDDGRNRESATQRLDELASIGRQMEALSQLTMDFAAGIPAPALEAAQ